MDNILEVSGLNKRYGNFALKDISFYLPEDCITGFVGINVPRYEQKTLSIT